MLTLKLAFRTLMRRKGRMALIGTLVAFGTFLIVFGGVFAASAGKASRESIIGNFTGDFIVYSAKSKELPSPFAFNTPLPNMRNADDIASALKADADVKDWTFYAQNYGIVEVEHDGSKQDLPIIFYAIDPESYKRVFPNVAVSQGSFFGDGTGTKTQGILISEYQNAQYLENYGVTLKAGDKVKLLGVTEGGANAANSSVSGIFSPIHYKSVFDYINFMDAATYATLYNFAGVESLPDSFNEGLALATSDEDSLFALAGNDSFGKLDVASLKARPLTGFTMCAVSLKGGADADAVIARLEGDPTLGVKAARWDKASGFYAQISLALQAFIFVATALIFLVVIMIFMNTLIINVVERTGEIGTMRAIGADKSFVRALFLAETLMLNAAAALVGIVASTVLLAIGSKGGFPLPEIVSQFLIGGGPLPLTVGFAPFAVAILTVLAVSVLATVYPVSVATSITPLKAMSDR
jgi:putative ABC transport system permease protein